MSQATFRTLYEYCLKANWDKYRLHDPGYLGSFRVRMFPEIHQVEIGEIVRGLFYPQFTVLFDRIHITGEVGVCEVIDQVPIYSTRKYVPEETPLAKLNYPKLKACLIKMLSNDYR